MSVGVKFRKLSATSDRFAMMLVLSDVDRNICAAIGCLRLVYAEAHKGVISISSELSKGAVVTVKFPLEMLA